MLEVQRAGCHNLNLVTPSHVVPQILEALYLAVEKGLNIPIVYNTGGYDDLETIRLLDGIVDIYMPDIKFLSVEVAKKLTSAPDYPDAVRKAVKEMHSQVGDLQIENGLARRGLMIRHLIMPNGMATTREVMKFLASEISLKTYVNLMDQYHPSGAVWGISELRRGITPQEYEEAVQEARAVGLFRFDKC